jgi:hypothetical protein
MPRTREDEAPILVDAPDVDQVVANYRAREPEAGEQRRRAEVSVLFGQWLAREATGCGVPVVPARPWSTVVDRVRALLDGAEF